MNQGTASYFKFVLIVVAIVLGNGTNLFAANRYVSKSGNDSNSGASWTQAWRSIQKVNSSTVGGDSVFFGTGVWNDTTLYTVSGTYSAPTVYACSALAAANGQGNYHFARIHGGTRITNWSQRGSSNVWIANYTSKRVNPPLFQGRSEIVWRVADSASVNSPGEYWNGNGRFVVWLHGNANPNNTEVVVGERYNAEIRRGGTAQKHIRFIGLSFEYSFAKGVTCLDGPQSDSVFFERCFFNQVAASGGTNTSHISLMANDGATDGSDYISVKACSLGYSWTWYGMDDEPVQTLSGNNASAMAVYQMRYSVIDSCAFFGEYHGNGTLFFKAAYGTNPTAWCEFDTVRNCTFTTTSNASIMLYNHVRNIVVYGNTFRNARSGVSFDYGTPGAWSDQPGFNKIFNNTFIGGSDFPAPSNLWYHAYGQSHGYSHPQFGNQIRYNIFYAESGTILAALDSVRFYTPSDIDSNLYFTTGTMSLQSPYLTTRSQSWWQNTAGFDFRSKFGTNPNFANPASADFSRPTSSQEMNRTYGGKTWTRYGAWQPPGGPCTLPGVPSLVSPTNAASGLLLPLTIDWSDVATATSYQIQIDDNADFSSPILTQTVGASSYQATVLSAGISLSWRVRAQNGCGSGNWSSSRVFTISCSTPAAPTLLSPSLGATNMSQPISLDWANVTGALLYEVQVDNNSDFSSPNLSQQTTNSAYSVGGLSSGTLFYWRSRAQNICGWGSWSVNRTFTTAGGDATPPVISGVTAKNITANSALITWTTNEDATTQIEYGTTTSYGSSTSLVSTLSMAHSQAITGLSPYTTYYFRVRSRDANGNEAVSGNYVFVTTEPLIDLDSGMQPTVSSSFAGYSPSRITDDVLNPYGGTSTTWAATESSLIPHWIEVNFGSSRVVKRVVIYWAWNSTQSRWMTSQNFRIQTWNGQEFVDVAAVTSTTADSCSFFAIPATTTTRVRYYQPANMGPATYSSVLWIAELDIFGLVNTAPSQPQLSSPANGMLFNTLSPTVTLGNSFDAEGTAVKYHFQISTNSGFTNVVAETSNQTQGSMGTTSWVVSPSLNAGSTYYWRARSHDDFLYSNFTSSRTFVISSTAVAFICGDVDRSGSVTVSDVVSLINFIFFGGTAPNPLQTADVDCSGNVTISDVVYLINYIFGGGQSACAGC